MPPSTADAVLPRWLAPTLRGYQRGWISVDILAGLAAGTVVVPQAMAYATIAGLPVQIGLYSCMLPMVVYALLGGSRSLSISTTSTIAVLVAATLAGRSTGYADALLRDAFTLTFLVGLCLLAMRLFRLGSLIENISPGDPDRHQDRGRAHRCRRAAAELCSVCEPDPDASGFFDQLWAVVNQLGDANGRTVARLGRRHRDPGPAAPVGAPGPRPARRRGGRHPPGRAYRHRAARPRPDRPRSHRSAVPGAARRLGASSRCSRERWPSQ